MEDNLKHRLVVYNSETPAGITGVERVLIKIFDDIETSTCSYMYCD